jgi:prephenate dehydratase
MSMSVWVLEATVIGADIGQAIGQSSKFLAERLPLAEVEHWPSTAAAALSLLDDSRCGTSSGSGAAICSKTVVESHPDLEVLYDGTQGIDSEPF